jgi:hypothetical protein
MLEYDSDAEGEADRKENKKMAIKKTLSRQQKRRIKAGNGGGGHQFRRLEK